MKKFFSKLFKANTEDKESNDLISFEVLNAIYGYLYHEDNSVTFKMKGIDDSISVNLYFFPSSFTYEEEKKQIKRNGFNNSYEVLNELYKKMDISLVSEEEIAQELEFDYIHVQFYSEPAPEMKSHFKRVLQNFIIFFCCIDGSQEINSFRILYSGTYFLDYIKSLIDAKYIDIKNPETEIEKIAFKDFETVLIGICQHLKIDLPQAFVQPNLMLEEVTVKHYIELISLLNRGAIDNETLQNEAQNLFEVLNETSDDDFFEVSFGFMNEVNTWNSDWKFDPEDAEYFISEMIEEALNFDYPEETYSHDLFPYIQTALAKQDYQLMNFDTKGDDYMFFVVDIKDVPRILELANMIGVGIDKL